MPLLRDRFLRWVGRTTHRYWWLVLITTRRGLSETTLLSAVAVALVVVIDFRAITPTLLALLPLLLSMAWMMGLIRILGMRFNLVNMAATPIILGIGVDFGVYILHRYMEEHGQKGRAF